MDPCLDDCVMLAKRLKSLGKSVTLDILEGLPHGFLSFVKVIKIDFPDHRSPTYNNGISIPIAVKGSQRGESCVHCTIIGVAGSRCVA